MGRRLATGKRDVRKGVTIGRTGVESPSLQRESAVCLPVTIPIPEKSAYDHWFWNGGRREGDERERDVGG